MLSTLFSFKGRIGRQTFLVYTLVILGIFFLLSVLFGVRLTNAAGVMVPGGIIFTVLFVWAWFALFIKRGNDIGIWWLWTALLTFFFAPITWVVYLFIGGKR
ncbi:putative membrane protein YhaH [Parelusimicrobium proximum]|uniref:DUF805 domain-containing protein n=1 Tax=Parelusimicrobium proximum TaxID=3228953 RepID=UPI003D16D82E